MTWITGLILVAGALFFFAALLGVFHFDKDKEGGALIETLCVIAVVFVVLLFYGAMNDPGAHKALRKTLLQIDDELFVRPKVEDVVYKEGSISWTVPKRALWIAVHIKKDGKELPTELRHGDETGFASENLVDAESVRVQAGYANGPSEAVIPKGFVPTVEESTVEESPEIEAPVEERLPEEAPIETPETSLPTT